MEAQWVVQLLPPLLRDAQLTAQQLPTTNMLEYPDLCSRSDIVQQLRVFAEEHGTEMSHRHGGTGTIYRPATSGNSRVGPVLLPGIAG